MRHLLHDMAVIASGVVALFAIAAAVINVLAI